MHGVTNAKTVCWTSNETEKTLKERFQTDLDIPALELDAFVLVSS